MWSKACRPDNVLCDAAANAMVSRGAVGIFLACASEHSTAGMRTTRRQQAVDAILCSLQRQVLLNRRSVGAAASSFFLRPCSELQLWVHMEGPGNMFRVIIVEGEYGIECLEILMASTDRYRPLPLFRSRKYQSDHKQGRFFDVWTCCSYCRVLPNRLLRRVSIGSALSTLERRLQTPPLSSTSPITTLAHQNLRSH